MKNIFFIYYLEARLLNLVKDVFLTRGYKEKGENDELNDRNFVILAKPEIVTLYKKYKELDGYNITFIGFDYSPRLEECKVYQYRNHFTHYFDSCFLSDKEVGELTNLILDSKEQHKPLVMFESFGFKFSNPIDVDLVIDSRCLPNAFWVNELRGKCGLDQEVKDYVFKGPDAEKYLKQTTDYISFYLENMEKRDRRMPLIGIACTGGQHRSIALAEYLGEVFKKDYFVFIKHREFGRFLCK